MTIITAITDFFGPGFDISFVITGIVILLITWWFLARDSRRDINEKKVTDKFAMRIVIAFLMASGVWLILATIQGIGFTAALVVAFVVFFVGCLWASGAEGRKATAIGLIGAVVTFLIISVTITSLPVDSPIRIGLSNFGNGLGTLANGWWDGFWRWINSIT